MVVVPLTLFAALVSAPEASPPTIKEARAAMRRRAFAEAVTLAEQVRQAAEGSAEAVAADRLAGDALTRLDRHRAAARVYRRGARVAAGAPRLRGSMLRLRARALRRARRPGAARKVQVVLQADGRVRRWRSRPGVGRRRLPGVLRDLASARRIYAADEDRGAVQFVQALRALVEVRSGAESAGEERARRLLDKEPLWPSATTTALHALRWAARGRDDPKQEAIAALRINAVVHRGRSADERRYRRVRAARGACRRYEAAHGAGACAVLAHEVTGEFSFVDPSRRRPRRSLDGAALARAQAQFLPALEDCLRTAARDDRNADLFEDATVEIGWTVVGTGRATEVHVRPRRFDSVVGPCVRERAAWMRYPRFRDGQNRTVSVPFTLTSVVR